MLISEQSFAYLFIWMSIFVYGMLASIDLGSGLFYVLSFLGRGPGGLREAYLSYSSARWESTNTFFVFIIVAAAAYFPSAAAAIASGWLPVLAIILIIFMARSAFLVYDYYSTGNEKVFLLIYSVAGLLILPAMSVIITSTLINVSHIYMGASAVTVSVNYYGLFENPITYLMIGIVFFGQLIFSSTFNIFYDKNSEDRPFYLRAAKITTVITFILIVIEFQLYYPLARYLFSALLRNVPYLLASGILFIAFIYTLFRRGESRLPFITFILSSIFGFLAIGLAQFPYLIYPELTAFNTFTLPASFFYLTATFFASLVLLVPALIFLNRMFVFEHRH